MSADRPAVADDPSDEQAKDAIEAQPPLCIDCKHVTMHDNYPPGTYLYTCSKCVTNKRSVVDGSLEHSTMHCWLARSLGECGNEAKLFEPKDKPN